MVTLCWDLDSTCHTMNTMRNMTKHLDSPTDCLQLLCSSNKYFKIDLEQNRVDFVDCQGHGKCKHCSNKSNLDFYWLNHRPSPEFSLDYNLRKTQRLYKVYRHNVRKGSNHLILGQWEGWSVIRAYCLLTHRSYIINLVRFRRLPKCMRTNQIIFRPYKFKPKVQYRF